VIRSPTEAEDFSSNICVQTGPGVHPASYKWVPGALSSGVKRGRGVMLTTHPLLVPRFRKSRSYTSSHPNAPLWTVTGPLYLFLHWSRYALMQEWLETTPMTRNDISAWTTSNAINALSYHCNNDLREVPSRTHSECQCTPTSTHTFQILYIYIYIYTYTDYYIKTNVAGFSKIYISCNCVPFNVRF
jgi:hypothetical protein